MKFATTKSGTLKAGYTLIELLIVLSIIGILFGIGFLGYREFSRRQLVTSAVRILRSDLRLAQSRALAGVKPDGCTQTLDGYAFRVLDGQTYTVEVICGTQTVVTKQVKLSSSLEMTTPEVNPVIFKPVGQGTNLPAGTAAVVAIKHSQAGNELQVAIGAGGEIQ